MGHTVGVVLSGCGYLDGAEIHEAVCTLLALDRYPDLEMLLDLPTPTPADAGDPLDPEIIRRQVQHAFDSAGVEWGAAYDVARHALTIEPNEHTNVFRLWAALEAGVRGDVDALYEYVRGVHNEGLSTSNDYAYHLLLTLDTFLRQAPEERRKGLGEVRELLREALAVYPNYRNDRSVAGMRDRIVNMITSSLAPFPLSYWYRWRLL